MPDLKSTDQNDIVKQKWTNKRRIAFISLCLFAVGLFLWFFLGKHHDSVLYGLDPNAQEKVALLPDDAPESIDIPGYPKEIEMESNQTSTHIGLYNPDENNVHLGFELVLGEVIDGNFVETETMFKSDLVKPGYEITKQKLTHTLEPGVYTAAINTQSYIFSQDTKEAHELNGVQNTVQLIVNDVTD